MTRTDQDLLHALRELERRADADGGPSTADIIATVTTQSRTHGSRLRWLAPLAAAALVGAVAIVATTVGGGDGGGNPVGDRQPGASKSATSASSPAPSSGTTSASTPPAQGRGATVLSDAAKRLDSTPWAGAKPRQFYYRRTTEDTTWTSVSGKKPGLTRTTRGDKITVPACVNGKIVAEGESGTCTLDSVSHYRADAPTTPSAWNAYLERIAPGAAKADAQGKIIRNTLYEDLLKPRAAAALLRYMATSCPGLRTYAVAPVAGHSLVGVTCTSMTNGSYGLAFDARTHSLAGVVPLDYQSGKVSGPAVVILRTGLVSAVGQRP